MGMFIFICWHLCDVWQWWQLWHIIVIPPTSASHKTILSPTKNQNKTISHICMQLKSFSKHFRSKYLLTSCSFTSMCGRLVWYKLWQAQMRLIIWNMSVDNKEQQFVIWHHSSGKIVGFVRNFVAPFYYNIIISRHYQGSLLGPGQKTRFQGK